MVIDNISASYAAALLAVARKSGGVETERKIGKELNFFAGLYLDNSAFRAFARNLALSNISKAVALKSSIDKIASGEISTLSGNFLTVLTKAGRLAKIAVIADYYTKLSANSHGEHFAEITTFDKLDENSRKILIEKLEKIFNGKMIMKYKENKQLLGGIKIRVDNLLLDNSHHGRLTVLKNKMMSSDAQSAV